MSQCDGNLRDLSISIDQFFYFRGEDPDAGICHQIFKSVHQQNQAYSKIVQIGAGWSSDTVHAASRVELC